MRILVIGAGAVGGYFGGRLAEAGRDVTFLVREGKAEKVRRRGLHIVSPYGDATIAPKVIVAEEIAEAYGLILVCVKAYSLEAAMDSFAAAVGPETIVLPFLNGMRHLELLSGRFGAESVMGGACFIAADVDQEQRIVQMTKVHQLIYGELGGGSSARVRSVEEALHGAKFDAKGSENIVQDLWEKWVMLASLGAATCLFRGTIGEIEAVAGGSAGALEILEECGAIAAAEGYAPRAAFVEWARKLLTAPGSGLTSSMYRDMSKNARVEVEQILGDLLERGRSHEVATPLLRAAFVNLSVYQARGSLQAR
jgi:2-dehydropantoate 2-reductase